MRALVAAALALGLIAFASRPAAEAGPLEDLSSASDPAGEVDRRDEGFHAWALAARILRRDERSALWLRYAEDLAPVEIARILGRPGVSVRVLLFRAREKLAALWLTWPLQAPLGLTVDDSYRPLEAVPKIAPIPLLVVHGLADRTVPPQHGRDLYAAAAEPKELWLPPGVGHIAAFTGAANRDRLVDYLSGCDPNNK